MSQLETHQQFIVTRSLNTVNEQLNELKSAIQKGNINEVGIQASIKDVLDLFECTLNRMYTAENLAKSLMSNGLKEKPITKQ